MSTPHVPVIPLLAASLLAGCAAAETESPPQPTATSTPAPAVAPDDHPADARFLQGMIPHHAQALVMADLVAERTDTEAVQLLAERIAVSQKSEIALMQSWLRHRGASVPPGEAHAHHAGGGMRMPGMLTQAQLDQLGGARGAGFDRLFLRFMIQHHQGALTMVDELFGTPGAGQGSAIYHLASEIDATQRAEIARMERVLAALPAAPSGR